MSDEIWKSVPWCPQYQVSTHGRVINTRTNQIIGNKLDGRYVRVTLRNAFIKRRVLLHRLIAQIFIPNPNNYPVINHKNGVRLDNRVENLEWCTHQHNVIHALKSGLKSGKKKGKLDKTQETVIFSLKDVIYQHQLARYFNVHQSTICHINQRHS